MVAEDTRFTPAEMLSWHDAGEELTLFAGASGQYFGLNGAAAAIWRELVAGRSIGETIDALAARFGRGHTSITDDVHSFVRDALERELLVAAE
jgi:predicted RNA-binding Zn ribbon-like protein